MEDNINRFKSFIKKACTKFGGNGDITYLGQAYHACNPGRPNGWSCDAMRIMGMRVELGKANWDFDEYVEENGEPAESCDFPWEDGGDDISDGETFNLEDELDFEHVLNQIKALLRY